MLNNNEIDALEHHLFSKENADTALDFYGLHGLIVANVISPTQCDIEVLWAIALGLNPDSPPECPEEIYRIIDTEQTTIKKSLEKEEPFVLPEEESEEDEDVAIQNWCTGFIEGHLFLEEEWFSKSEEIIAELLLPILSLSEFFDEMEMEDLQKNAPLMAQMIEQIPEVVTDLYLLFHSK